MRKNTVILFGILIILSLSGCGDKETDISSVENEMQHADVLESGEETDNEWRENADELILCEKTGANLVSGEKENSILVRKFVEDMMISLTVCLEDGFTETVQYPISTEKDFVFCKTAYLQYADQESIVLEIVNGTSNYGAAEYHILHVETGNGNVEIVEDVTISEQQADLGTAGIMNLPLPVTMTIEDKLLATAGSMTVVKINGYNSENKEVETYTLEYEQAPPVWVLRGVTNKYVSEYNALNLDGIGDNDDRITVTSLLELTSDGGEDTWETGLYIELGDGQTMELSVPVSGKRFVFDTAPLFSEERDAVVLEIDVPYSNYGAADLFVWDVFQDENGSVQAVNRFSTTDLPEGEYITLSSGQTIELDGSIISGTEICNVAGTKLKGLKLLTGDRIEGMWVEDFAVIYWQSGEWQKEFICNLPPAPSPEPSHDVGTL